MEKPDENVEDGRIHLRDAEDEVAAFQKTERNREKRWGIVTILFLVYAAVFLVSLIFLVEYSGGARWQFSLAYYIEIVRQNFYKLYNFIIGNFGYGGINYQLIRYAIVGLIGASLAACGALMQGTFRNVLAGPSTMGIQSGATLGNMIYVLFFYESVGTIVVYSYEDMEEMSESSTFVTNNLQQLLVFGCALAGVGLVMGVALLAGRGKVSSSAMILAGTVFSTVISSFTSLIQYYIIIQNPSDERIQVMRSLSMGDMNRVYSVQQLLIMLAFLLPCMVILGLIAGRMNILSFGEDAAQVMGINVRLFRFIMIMASTLMTAIITAYVGQIGFIGFMVPQVTRRLVGPDFRRLFPASIAFGALLLTIIYDVARFLGMTSSLNMFTSLLGSFVMLFVLLNRRNGGRAYADGR